MNQRKRHFARARRIAVTIAASFVVTPVSAALISLPGLQSVSFIEGTGGAFNFSFGSASAQMTTRLGNPLGGANNDFTGLANEFYDVFYSDSNGAFNVLGDFITVEARYTNTSGGGGLNISQVSLNFLSGSSQVANVLTSFVGMGTNFLAGSQFNAVDGNPATFTAMGNTGNSETDRLRITVGFRDRTVSEPGTLALLGLGIVAAGWVARRRRTH